MELLNVLNTDALSPAAFIATYLTAHPCAPKPLPKKASAMTATASQSAFT
ncbi:hypothetical protein [Paraburkholderia caribensis]